MNRTLIVSLCVSISICYCVNHPSRVIEEKIPAQGLVAEYLFNDSSAADSSGNSYDGVVHNAVPTTDRRQMARSAFLFDGSSSFIIIPDSSRAQALHFDTNAFSVSAWICTKANTTGEGDVRKQNILSKGNPYDSGYTLSMFQNRFSGFVGGTGRIGYDSTDKAIADSAWHHVVVRRKAGVVQLYVDTLPQHSYNFSGSAATMCDMFIGKHGTKSEGYFDGSIDNVRIYNRALDESEISRLFRDPY